MKGGMREEVVEARPGRNGSGCYRPDLSVLQKKCFTHILILEAWMPPL